jgi:tetratricopeptide (TPR) repeat protein
MRLQITFDAGIVCVFGQGSIFVESLEGQTMKRKLGILGATIPAALIMSIVHSAANDFDVCARESGNVAISACTRAIVSEEYRGIELSRLFNNRCWERTILGQLQAALADCNESLRLDANRFNPFDTRGLLYLKLGQFDRAIADYDAALKLDPKSASSLYGRGFAKLKIGTVDAGNADVGAAKAIQADIAKKYESYGLK